MDEPIIVGNISATDDFPHQPGPEENYNESVYFNFVDPATRFGGFIRVGNRVHEGYAEMTVTLFRPDGAVAFTYAKPEIDTNERWDAGGATIEVIKPGLELQTKFGGRALLLQDPLQMTDPRSAYANNPTVDIRLDLTHAAVGPMYGHQPKSGKSVGEGFAAAHYEQHMHVSGTVIIGSDGDPLEVFPIEGNGLRDHSWGPRYWQNAESYRWITGNFGDDLGMLLLPGRSTGVFHRGTELIPITASSLTSKFAAGPPGTDARFHTGLTAQVTLANGEEHVIEGRVLGFMPLRNRRGGATTYIGEGLTEYTLDGDRVGYGISEYLDQPSAPFDD